MVRRLFVYVNFCGFAISGMLGPVLEGPEMFSHTERRKISNLMITELFYSHTLNINRGFLHVRSFKCLRLSVFRLSKNSFADGPQLASSR